MVRITRHPFCKLSMLSPYVPFLFGPFFISLVPLPFLSSLSSIFLSTSFSFHPPLLSIDGEISLAVLLFFFISPLCSIRLTLSLFPLLLPSLSSVYIFIEFRIFLYDLISPFSQSISRFFPRSRLSRTVFIHLSSFSVARFSFRFSLSFGKSPLSREYNGSKTNATDPLALIS